MYFCVVFDVGVGKKCFIVFVDWYFGGGDVYCKVCEGLCLDCLVCVRCLEILEGW